MTTFNIRTPAKTQFHQLQPGQVFVPADEGRGRTIGPHVRLDGEKYLMDANTPITKLDGSALIFNAVDITYGEVVYFPADVPVRPVDKMELLLA